MWLLLIMGLNAAIASTENSSSQLLCLNPEHQITDPDLSVYLDELAVQHPKSVVIEGHVTCLNRKAIPVAEFKEAITRISASAATSAPPPSEKNESDSERGQKIAFLDEETSTKIAQTIQQREDQARAEDQAKLEQQIAERKAMREQQLAEAKANREKEIDSLRQKRAELAADLRQEKERQAELEAEQRSKMLAAAEAQQLKQEIDQQYRKANRTDSANHSLRMARELKRLEALKKAKKEFARTKSKKSSKHFASLSKSKKKRQHHIGYANAKVTKKKNSNTRAQFKNMKGKVVRKKSKNYTLSAVY